MTDKLPGARAALVDNAGVTTPPFYRYFQALERLQAGTASAADVAAINAQIAAINAEIAALPKSSYPTLQVSAPLTSAGLLQNGFARLGWKGTTSDVPEGTNLYYTDARVDARLSPGYIDGLQMQWVSGTAVTVSSGTAYIPGLGHYLQSNAAIAPSGLTLSASTWYHLYLYSNAGTPAVECVTTAPVLYYGTAYQKTGDNTRRYIGSIVTDSSGAIYPFVHDAADVNYATLCTGAPFRILANGIATSVTPVYASAVVPVTAFEATARIQNTATTQAANFGIGAPFNALVTSMGSAGKTSVFSIGLGVAQDIVYALSGSDTSGLYIDIIGYAYRR